MRAPLTHAGLPRVSRAALPLALLVLCIAMGWAVVQQSKMAMLVVAAGGSLAVVGAFAEMGLAALWLWPALGAIAYPLAPKLPGHPYATFDRIWVVGLIVVLATLPAVRAHARASRRMMIGFGLLAATIGVRSLLTPGHTTLGPTRVWFDSIMLPLILFAVVRRAVARDEGVVEKVAFALMTAGVVLGLIGIAEKLAGFELATAAGSEVRFDQAIGQVRIAGPYDAPEPYGLALIICLAATMYWYLSRPRTGLVHFASIGVVGVELLGISLTFFRVGWISAVLVLMAAFGLRPKRYARAVGTIVVCGLVVALAFTQLERIPAVSNRVGNTENISVRLATYKQGFQIFRDHPLFGVGATKYEDVATGLPAQYVSGQPSRPHPHSSFFGVLAEDGVFGFVGFIAALVAGGGLVRALGRVAPTGPDAVLSAVLAGAGVSYLLYSLTLTMLPYSPPNELLAMLLGAAAGRLDFHRRQRAAPAIPRV